MNQFVLDTDMLTLFQVGHAFVVANVTAHCVGGPAVTVISDEEQLGGWYTRLRRAKKREELAAVYERLTDTVAALAQCQLFSFTVEAIRRYEGLRAKHRTLSKNDLRIAAIVLENAGTLVTRNTRDFRAISGLRIEDWSK